MVFWCLVLRFLRFGVLVFSIAISTFHNSVLIIAEFGFGVLVFINAISTFWCFGV